MGDEEKALVLFTTRVRQMILHYKEVKQENDRLHEKVKECTDEIDRLQAQMVSIQDDYNSLKMAKMVEIADRDIEKAKARLAKLIRDVNKCITLLAEK
ncbi:MAG: hypothetical protein SPI30_04360 [Prevotella sp.]|nr:hypothetical protein [Prevotella sp.]